VSVLALLIPVSVVLGLVGLAGFLWLLRHGHFDDPEGHATRILSDCYDDAPADNLPRPERPSSPAAGTRDDRPK
jgi:cbb3-type cytochrome oxidase maturation protein